jgi:hypothetical protein
MPKESPLAPSYDGFEAVLVQWLRAEQAAGTDSLGIGIFAQGYKRVADAVERGELRAYAEHVHPESERPDVSSKRAACKAILTALRSPLVLMSVPTREEAMKLARDFDVTAQDLIEFAIGRARDT